jgi:SnoaL-like domain
MTGAVGQMALCKAVAGPAAEESVGEQQGRGEPIMQTSDNADDADGRAVATALHGVIVRGEQNVLADTAAPGIAGARAALETFYYAFNTRSPDLLQQIWADDPLVQVGSPVASMVRGSASIVAGYERMFSGPARVQTVVEDIVAYATPELVVFAGRERGAYTPDSEHSAMSELPDVRSICVFRFIAAQGGWRLVYHHVWLDDADQLARYQRAVRGA